MSSLRVSFVALVVLVLSSLLAAPSPAQAEKPSEPCLLAELHAPLEGEPAGAFREVKEYGRSTVEVSGPGRLTVGEAAWSSYSLDLHVNVRRGEVAIELFRSEKGHYALRMSTQEIRLERVSPQGAELLEQAEGPFALDRWRSVHIDLNPTGSEDRVQVSLDGEVVIGNPGDGLSKGGVALKAPQGSQVLIRGFRVEGPCPQAKKAPAKGCASPTTAKPPTLRGPVLEAAESVGQWHRGELNYDVSDFFDPPVELKFRGAYTDETCPKASSALRFRVDKEGIYYLMARVFIPDGRGQDERVRVAMQNESKKVIEALDGVAEVSVYGHGTGLVALGIWSLKPGLYTLDFAAKTRHRIVVDYFVLLPQIKSGGSTWALLPQSGGMHWDGWRNGMAALAVESSSLTSTPRSTMTVPLRVPTSGPYRLLVDAWYAGRRASLKVSLAGSGGTVEWTIDPDWAAGGWATQLLGPVYLKAGEADLTFTHGGSGDSTTWATDTILLIPE